MFWDTTAFIDYIRGLPIAVQTFDRIQAGSELGYCSVITEAELWAGIRNIEEELTVAAALSEFTVIPVNSSVARLAGRLLRNVGGNKAHFGDAIIAATSIQQGETVLTADAASQRVFGDRAEYLVYR